MCGQLYLDTMHDGHTNLFMRYLSIRWSDLKTENAIVTIRVATVRYLSTRVAEMLIKCLLLLWYEIMGVLIKGFLLLWSGILKCRSKVFFYFDLDLWEMAIKGLLLLWFGIKMLVKGLLLLWYGIEMLIKGLLLLQSGIEMLIKGLLFLWFGIEMSIKGLLLLWSGIEMLIKGLLLLWSRFVGNGDQRSSSTLIWICCLQKVKFLELNFNWWVLHDPTVFEMCDFHLLILDLKFIKKTFDFWNFEVLKFLFRILRLWKFEILNWNLEFEI